MVDRTRLEYHFARWQVSRRVKLAYWSARGAQEIRDVLQATAANFQKTVDYHTAQFSAGAIPEVDYLRVRLESERLKIAAGLAMIDANRARIELLREMGQTDFADVALTEPLLPGLPVIPAGIEQVLAERMEIKVAKAAVDQAQADVKLQDVLARPDLTVAAGFKRTQLLDATSGVNTAIAGFKITLPTADKNQGNREAHERKAGANNNYCGNQASIRAEYAGALQEYELRRAEFVNALQPLREHAANVSEFLPPRTAKAEPTSCGCWTRNARNWTPS